MTILFRLLLTGSSLLLSIFVFMIAKGKSISDLNIDFLSSVTIIPSMFIYFLIVAAISFATIKITFFIHDEIFYRDTFSGVEIANDSFLP